jgi:catechol 2,3-dioxygenase-like lactoylglutathione lyase family enzyme
MRESSSVVAFIAATDLDRARLFYEQRLGLTVTEQTGFACVFDANGTMLRVTAVPDVAHAVCLTLLQPPSYQSCPPGTGRPS